MTVLLVGRGRAKRGIRNDADLNGLSQSQDAQLFELLQLLQRMRRALGQVEQEVTAIGVQAEVLQEARRTNAEIGLTVADERNGTAAEVQSATGGVADDL